MAALPCIAKGPDQPSIIDDSSFGVQICFGRRGTSRQCPPGCVAVILRKIVDEYAPPSLPIIASFRFRIGSSTMPPTTDQRGTKLHGLPVSFPSLSDQRSSLFDLRHRSTLDSASARDISVRAILCIRRHLQCRAAPLASDCAQPAD